VIPGIAAHTPIATATSINLHYIPNSPFSQGQGDVCKSPVRKKHRKQRRPAPQPTGGLPVGLFVPWSSFDPGEGVWCRIMQTLRRPAWCPVGVAPLGAVFPAPPAHRHKTQMNCHTAARIVAERIPPLAASADLYRRRFGFSACRCLPGSGAEISNRARYSRRLWRRGDRLAV